MKWKEDDLVAVASMPGRVFVVDGICPCSYDSRGDRASDELRWTVMNRDRLHESYCVMESNLTRLSAQEAAAIVPIVEEPAVPLSLEQLKAWDEIVRDIFFEGYPGSTSKLDFASSVPTGIISPSGS